MTEPATAHVMAETPNGAALSLVDVRPPKHIDLGPLRLLEQRQGPAVEAVRAQAEVFRADLNAELSCLAGNNPVGAHVQMMAHLAVDTMVQQRLLSLAASGAAGRWVKAALSEVELDEHIALLEKREAAMVHCAKHAAGLAVIARDLLLAARAAAREQAESNRGTNTVDQLFAQLQPAAGGGRPVDQPEGRPVDGPVTPGLELGRPAVPPVAPGGESIRVPPSLDCEPQK